MGRATQHHSKLLLRKAFVVLERQAKESIVEREIEEKNKKQLENFIRKLKEKADKEEHTPKKRIPQVDRLSSQNSPPTRLRESEAKEVENELA